MNIYKLLSNRKVILFTAIIFLFSGILSWAEDTQSLHQKARSLQRLLKEKEAQGVDTTRARNLDKLSRQAAQRGDFRQAEQLLEEAIAILEEDRPFPKRNFGNLEDKDSPFGIFNPYITIIDNPSLLTKEKINAYLKDLGVSWVQSMPADISDYLQAGLNIYSRALTGTPSPKIPPDYQEKLKQTVRKYKGVVKYWEADTEPGGTSWRGYPREYAEFLKLTFEAIKEEDPEAYVVFGGLPGDFRIIDENSKISRFLDEVLQVYGARYFDAFEFKLHHHQEDEFIPLLENRLEVFGNILAKYGVDIKKIPLFIETAMYDGSPQDPFKKWPYQSERIQAKGLVKAYVFALSRGVDKIFWNLVVERGPRERRNGVFQNYGLIHHPDNDGLSHKKLAYFTYKKMVEVLEGADWENIETVREKDGVYIYKFKKEGKPLWVAWNDNEKEKEITITLEKDTKDVQITEAVPHFASGKEVTSYSTAFNKLKGFVLPTYPMQLKFTLGDSPVFVEEK